VKPESKQMTEKFSKSIEALQNLPKPKAVIFDWDNTLVDTWPLIHAAIDKTMTLMGHQPWGFEKVRDTVHKSMRESFPEIFGDEWEKAGEIYKDAYRSMHLEKIMLLPKALELINELESKGITQFIVSNKMGPTLRKEAAKIGVEKKFFALIGAGDSNNDKPHKDHVDLALLGSDLDPAKDEIWFIGDTIADVECAYNSGCRPIVFGDFKHGISKTIPESWMENGKMGKGVLPLYFDHQELVEVIKKF